MPIQTNQAHKPVYLNRDWRGLGFEFPTPPKDMIPENYKETVAEAYGKPFEEVTEIAWQTTGLVVVGYIAQLDHSTRTFVTKKSLRLSTA